MTGFYNILKPSGTTSSKVVAIVKHNTHEKRVGHMGTLDPLAEGVLPIAVGKATKLFDYFLNKTKTYIATFEFGYITDTLDSLGSVTQVNGVIPTFEQVENILPTFVGVMEQVPPQYSAKNVNGKRAYTLARMGETFELKPKKITIQSIKLLDHFDKSFVFEIECSSGTYIRSICRDIAFKLGTLATMTKLVRTKCGYFTIDNAIKLDDFQNNMDKLIAIDKVFNFEHIVLDDVSITKLKNGIKLQSTNENKIVFVYNSDLVGVGKIENNQLSLVIQF